MTQIRKKVWGLAFSELVLSVVNRTPHRQQKHTSQPSFLSPNKDKNFFKSCQVFLNVFFKKVGATFESRKSGAYKRECGDGRFRSVAPKGDTNWCMS
jgi:hypothetical protein